MTVNDIKPFRIVAGPERGEAQLGFLEYGDRSRLRAEHDPVDLLGLPGTVIVFNLFNVWGRRVAGDRKEGVQVTDKDYKGEIEFLKHGDVNGYQIPCRWMQGHDTIDYYYQVNRLGLPTHNSEAGGKHNYPSMPMGEAEIDPKKDKSYAAFVKFHPMNRDSICRSPDSDHWMWQEIKEFAKEKAEAKKEMVGWDAVGLVKQSASSIKKLNILFDLIGGDTTIKYDKADDGSKFDNMVIYAKENPEKVLEAVESFKREMNEVVAKAESYKALDTSKKNAIHLKVGEKKILLIDDIPSTGKQVQWFYENALEPRVFEAYGKLKMHAENDFK